MTKFRIDKCNLWNHHELFESKAVSFWYLCSFEAVRTWFWIYPRILKFHQKLVIIDFKRWGLKGWSSQLYQHYNPILMSARTSQCSRLHSCFVIGRSQVWIRAGDQPVRIGFSWLSSLSPSKCLVWLCRSSRC
jgi:hypothetical protein